MKKATSQQIADFHGILADVNRIDILRLLAKERIYQDEFSKLLPEVGIGKVYTQLKILEDKKFIKSKEIGERILYTSLFTQETVNKYLSMV